MTRGIAIDCRKIEDFGIGTYLRGLLSGFREIGRPERLLLVGGGERSRALADGRVGWEFVQMRCAPYSAREQLLLGRLARLREGMLWHFPHYVVPAYMMEPVVVTIHDLIHIERPWDRSRAAFLYAHYFVARAVKRSRLILTGSQAVRRAIEERFPQEAGKIRVVAHGIDDYWEQPVSTEERLGIERWTKNRRPLLLYVGNDLPHKGLAVLAQALLGRPEILRGSGLLVLVGGETRARSLLVRELGDRVVILGRQPRDVLRALYHACDLFVFPSLAEGFGLPPLEALAAGAPLLVSDLPVLREVLPDHATFVPPGNAVALGECMVRLLSGSCGHARSAVHYTRRYDWSISAQRTMEVYDEVS